MNHVFLVGVILLLALVGGHLVQRIRVPEIVGYLLIGLILGPSFSEILTRDVIQTLEIFSEIALGLILFSIGSVFEFENLKKVGRQTLVLTVVIMAGTFLIVFFSALLLLNKWQVALLLGVISTEISPIATILVLREMNADGPLSETVYNILAINNVICVLAFGIAAFIIRSLSGPSELYSYTDQLFFLLWETVGSISLGILLGHVLALWGRRVEEHGEVLILVLGMLLIVVGVCHLLGLSSLIVTLTLGATLINLEKRSKHLFSVLGRTDPPLYAIFFVLAGADLDITSLKSIGIAGLVYTGARIIGKIGGSFCGARLLRMSDVISKYLGFTLVSHAGVAIGLVLQTRSSFPQFSIIVSSIILASVLINEILGPILTRLAVSRAGEIRSEKFQAFEGL